MSSGYYRQKALRHYGEVCQVCGSHEDIEVHHIDGDQTNDQIENLMCLCSECHIELHSEGLQGLENALKPVEERDHLNGVEDFEMAIDGVEKRPTPKEDRLETVITELLVRCEQGSDEPEISTTEIYELLGGQVSRASCLNYLHQLARRPGLDKTNEQRGGWGGGTQPKCLKMDVRTFVEECSIEQLRFVNRNWLTSVVEA